LRECFLRASGHAPARSSADLFEVVRAVGLLLLLVGRGVLVSRVVVGVRVILEGDAGVGDVAEVLVRPAGGVVRFGDSEGVRAVTAH
jgi:hypothetical protein